MSFFSHSCLLGLMLVKDVVLLPWFVLLKPECELKLDGCPDVCRTLLHVDGLLEATLEAVPAHGGSLFTHVAGVGLVVTETKSGHLSAAWKGFRHQPVADESSVDV